MQRIVAFADDLTGAAECAAALGRGTCVALDSDSLDLASERPRLVIDLDVRQATEAHAFNATGAVLRSVHEAAPAVVVGKIDSRLRGNIAASTLAAVRMGYRVVMTPSLPALGRTVRDGVARTGSGPRRVSDALSSPATLIRLDTVRGAAETLRDRIEQVSAAHIAICDAETTDDLDRIVAAAGALPDVVLFGSSALVDAVSRSAEPVGTGCRDQAWNASEIFGPAPAGRPLVFVIGTAEPSAHRQVLVLERAGIPIFRVSPNVAAGPPERTVAIPAGALDTGVAAVVIDQSAGAVGDPGQLVTGLVASARPLLAAADLMLTGGETARTVLDELGITALVVDGQTEYGTVFSRTHDGRRVVTRPGSFGGPRSLTNVLYALRPNTAVPPEREQTR